MTEQEQLMQQALAEMKLATIKPETWCKRTQQGYPPGTPYNYKATHNFKAQDLLYKASRAVNPNPAPASPFGVGGVFLGRGIMLGGNHDVWDQALSLARDGFVEVVAFPQNVSGIPDFPDHVHVVRWCPPELVAASSTDITQAESQFEWNKAIQTHPSGIVLNSWEYGHFPTGCVALVEAYYNEGWGVNFEVFKNYMPQGAVGVIPVCGGYSASGRSDQESADNYKHLSTWSGGPFPGFWMYAGESMITPESVEVLKSWHP